MNDIIYIFDYYNFYYKIRSNQMYCKRFIEQLDYLNYSEYGSDFSNFCEGLSF